MGLRDYINENRAEEQEVINESSLGDLLLQAIISKAPVTKESALNIPSVSGCIEYIGNMVSMLPLKLYEESTEGVKEIKNDSRTLLLNDDPKDTLNAVEMWRAVVEDYFLGKGGFVYIDRVGNSYNSLRYVKEEHIGVIRNNDPIFKDYDYMVNGQRYPPYMFFRILRKTKDGAEGRSILKEVPSLIKVSYAGLIFEENMVSTGGNKRGFLQAEHKLDQDTINDLKASWKKLYSSDSEENVVVLNKGISFKEASNTSVEMQINENKKTNAEEICKVFNVPIKIISGGASEQDHVNGVKFAVMPVIKAIENAANRALLLEREKKTRYFAFDTKELTRGDIKSRYEAYKMGIDSNFLKIDEARYMEDLPGLGLDWIKLGLDSVLYNPTTKEVYTPNTDKTTKIEGGDNGENRDQE